MGYDRDAGNGEALNDQRDPETSGAVGVLVFSLAEAEELVALLDELCCRMRGEGRDDDADVEIDVEMPTPVSRSKGRGEG